MRRGHQQGRWRAAPRPLSTTSAAVAYFMRHEPQEETNIGAVCVVYVHIKPKYQMDQQLF